MTSGVVSRIEVTSYVHGSTELLGVQIDAAINSGNSGRPVPCLIAASLQILCNARSSSGAKTSLIMQVAQYSTTSASAVA